MEAAWSSYLALFSDVVVRIRDVSSKDFPPEAIAQWLGEGCREFARRSELVSGAWLGPLIPGQRLYRLPADCLRLTKVRCRYPGNTADRELPYWDQYTTLDSYAQSQEGEPQNWYLEEGADQVGLYLISNLGGFLGDTAGNGNVGGTTVVLPAIASAVDDFYNGMELRILDGSYQGQQQTISDYDGATRTATVDTAFSGQIVSGVRACVGPEQLRFDYVAAGNDYQRQDVNGVVLAAPAPGYASLAATLTQRPTDFWKGWEVYFTAGNLKDERTRVVTSEIVAGTPASTVLTLWPELVTKPTAADTFQLRVTPNIPGAFHPALVAYALSVAKGVLQNPSAVEDRARFDAAIAQAAETAEPDQDQEFEGVREYAKGDEEWGEGW